MAAKSENKLYNIISYNVMSDGGCSGLLTLIDIEKPDIIMLQEILLDTEHLTTFLTSKQGYKAVSNVDQLEPNKPGTALVWHESVPVTRVTSIEPRRLQTAFIGPYPLVNIYPPAGSDNGPGRRVMFRDSLFRVMRGLGGKLPIMGGDWNCVISIKDIEGGDYNKKKSQDLQDLIRDFNMIDAYRHLFPGGREFTWARKDKFRSRLDRIYLPQELVSGLKMVTHNPFMSDHSYVKLVMLLPEIAVKVRSKKQYDSGFWKLNTSVLEEEDFLLEFKVMWERVKQDRQDFSDIADWWDQRAKPECRALCMRYSAMTARSRRDLKDMLMVMLASALEESNWVDMAIIRGRLKEIMNKENLGFVVRSRFKENIEGEKASLYHLNREKKKSGQKTLSKMMINKEVVEDQETVEKEVSNFFGALLQGHHRRGAVNVGTTFQPDFSGINEFLQDLGQLTDTSKAKIMDKVNMVELEIAMEQLEDHKAPGLDGLPAEFYKKTEEVIKKEFLEVINCQLDRQQLVESDRHGATRLGPKVDGVPRVDQLRPITLLNLDYKILTKILTNRLLQIMGEVIRSGQSCSVPGQNILFGGHNILSAIQYVEKYGGKAAVVSYDLYKAYDRVCLPFLYKVMEQMNFGQKFIDWIRMLHAGATTCFILNFLTNPIDLLISVRQGDPLAMVLFILYMEPLLMVIRKNIKGVSFLGERVHLPWLQGTDQEQRNGEFCANTKDSDYVDDVNLCIDDEKDLEKVDEIFMKFENLSGAILNRDLKTKIMGVGDWTGKEDWVLPWIRTVPSIKIFGITFHPTYKQIQEDNWNQAMEGFNSCLMAWKTRSLDSIFQKVELLKTFALPKLWYKALLLPLPGKVASKLEDKMRNFIWRGKLEKPATMEMFNPVESGGLGLTCVRTKADSLLLKQVLRMLGDNTAVHHNHLKFWLGKMLHHWADLANYPHAMRTGDSPYAPLPKEAALTPHFEKLLLEIKYAEKNNYFNWVNFRQMTAKKLYQLNSTTFPPPAIIYKRDVPDWHLVWSRVGSVMLEPRAREVLYMVVNNLFPTQDRLFRINMDKRADERRVKTSVCQRCKQGVVEDCQHLFTECDMVREGWGWLRARIMILLPDCQGYSNWEILHLLFPKDGRMENEMVWLLGQWVQLVYQEVVIRGRVMEDKFVRGHMRYKYYESLRMKMPQLGHINDITVFDPG